jgi:hypothetical protein
MYTVPLTASTYSPLLGALQSRFPRPEAASPIRDTVPRPEIAYYPRALAICALPVRRPSEGQWTHQFGDCALTLTSHGTDGLPYGQDRLIPLLLGTLAQRQDSRTLCLGSAYQMLNMFGIAPDGRGYQRLEQRFERIASCTFQVTRWEGETERTTTFRLFEERSLWYELRSRQSDLAQFVSSVTLSEEFWNELRNHSLAVDLNVVKGLLHAPGNLDFYLWMTMRAQNVRRGRFTKAPLFGKDSLFQKFGGGYMQQRDFRKGVHDWLRNIRELWLDCPAVLSTDGRYLLICNHKSPFGN